MTAYEIKLVQDSWNKLKPMGQQAGELFYSKLFIAAPGIRHMFRGDISEQAHKLIFMLTYAVSRLSCLESIETDIRKLALRHNNYGAKPEHYDIVGECLLATLQQGLNGDWNEELRKAWTKIYTTLSKAMIEAQQSVQEIPCPDSQKHFQETKSRA
jgi:hemoglobin-like flavoprotein